MIYSKIVGGKGVGWGGGVGGLQWGLTAPPLPTKPPSAKFASQGNAHVRTDAQIQFLYYPLYTVIGY